MKQSEVDQLVKQSEEIINRKKIDSESLQHDLSKLDSIEYLHKTIDKMLDIGDSAIREIDINDELYLVVKTFLLVRQCNLQSENDVIKNFLAEYRNYLKDGKGIVLLDFFNDINTWSFSIQNKILHAECSGSKAQDEVN